MHTDFHFKTYILNIHTKFTSKHIYLIHTEMHLKTYLIYTQIYTSKTYILNTHTQTCISKHININIYPQANTEK